APSGWSGWTSWTCSRTWRQAASRNCAWFPAHPKTSSPHFLPCRRETGGEPSACSIDAPAAAGRGAHHELMHRGVPAQGQPARKPGGDAGRGDLADRPNRCGVTIAELHRRADAVAERIGATADLDVGGHRAVAGAVGHAAGD